MTVAYGEGGEVFDPYKSGVFTGRVQTQLDRRYGNREDVDIDIVRGIMSGMAERTRGAFPPELPEGLGDLPLSELVGLIGGSGLESRLAESFLDGYTGEGDKSNVERRISAPLDAISTYVQQLKQVLLGAAEEAFDEGAKNSGRD